MEAQKVQKATTAAILERHCRPQDDIAAERSRATFKTEDLTVLLYGRKRMLRRRELVKALEADPVFNKDDIYSLPRTEMYRKGLRIMMALQDLHKKLDIDITNPPDRDDIQFLRACIGLNLPDTVHQVMFLPTLMAQGSPEQQAKWLLPALQYEIMGTYAQTELGHGTFLRGLETTATYNAAQDSFVLHTPTLSGTKWWPGGLGKTVNHVVLYARLFLHGKDYGPHAFVVQLRDLETHMPLPGVEVGDIGPKLGYRAIDNGFLRFDHVEIPRTNMLSKFARVTAEGVYERAAPSKANYGTMVFVRAQIVAGAFHTLAKATTVAVRYSAIRRQGGNDESGGKEMLVLDYQMQKYNMLRLVATSYALFYTSKYMLSIYNAFVAQSGEGDFSMLPELHGASSGLKALASWLTADGIEVCRKACGGHGYSLYSGLGAMLNNYVANCTLEGDNYVMALQTARYLMKAHAAGLRGESVGSMTSYLTGKQHFRAVPMDTQEDLFNVHSLLELFRQTAAREVVAAAEDLAATQHQRGQSPAEAWNSNAKQLISAAMAHTYYVLARNFATGLAECTDPVLKRVLTDLYHLFCLSVLDQRRDALLLHGIASPAQARLIGAAALAATDAVRPNAVALVDAFDIPDYALGSALGCYDGNAYERLYRWAKSNPMNHSEIGPGVEEYILGKNTPAKL